MVRTWVFFILVAGGMVLADNSEVLADHYGGGGYGGCGVRRAGLARGIYGGGSGYRGRSGACGYTRRYATGSPWSVLRRYMTPGGAALRYVYVRNYFFRRYPYLFTQGTPEAGEQIGPDHYLHPAYDVAANPLTERQELHLGAWKFFLADYKAADTSFAKVVAVNAKSPEAHWGRALSAAFRREWKNAAKYLAQVAELGELRIDDHLMVEGVFGDAQAIERLLGDVKVATRYTYGNGDAHIVAAWLHISQGNRRLAGIHLKKAEKWSPGNAASKAIAAQLAGQQPKPAPAPSVTPKTAPTTPKTKTPVLVASR